MANTKITSRVIADDAITSAAIADNAIDSAQIADGAVDDIHLATGITASKLTGALPAISGAALTGIDAATVSSTAPSSPAEGDMWFNSSASTVSNISSKSMAVWSGTDWVQMSTKFSATGGTETTYTSGGVTYKVHTFTTSG